MKVFEQRQLGEARKYSVEGGQALHLMSGDFAYLRRDTPSCFKGKKVLAHLFDQDRERLVKTVKRLGVSVIRVEREGTESQHIDLCGKPLERALSEARKIEPEQPSLPL